MEELKRALMELVEREPDFLADLLARLDGRLAERLLARPEAVEAFARAAASPEAVRTFALAVAGDREALRTFAAAVARDPEAARLMAEALMSAMAFSSLWMSSFVAIFSSRALRSSLVAMLRGMATCGAVAAMVTKEDAARFATKEDVKALADRVGVLGAGWPPWRGW